MRNLPARVCIASAGLLALAACSTEPITLSQGFKPTESSLSAHKSRDGQDICRIHIGDVTDKRTEKDTLGQIGDRVIRDADPAAWLRSGLLTLDRDKRIAIADSAKDADLDLDVDLLKAYIISITSDKSANVVVRVRYSRGGADAGERVIRGTETGWNWNNGAGEVKTALDDALEDLLKSLAQDVETRCAAPRAAQPPPQVP